LSRILKTYSKRGALFYIVALPDIQKSIESARKGMQEDIAAMVKERELKSVS
jgi:hypothetical protein